LKTSVLVPNNMEILSRLTVANYVASRNQSSAHALSSDLDYLASLNPVLRIAFLQLAQSHHVIVRSLQVVENTASEANLTALMQWCKRSLEEETSRIRHAIDTLHPICSTLENSDCPVAVIKSLDHWPDLGSDIDLYTTATPERVIDLMRTQFDAVPVARSWGDRLAGKWNFRVPGLPELIEIHVRYLGQTGEHVALAHRIIARRVRAHIAGFDFFVPAPEERIMISALQRVYRHFYFRLCDMVEMAALVDSGAVDFDELRNAASASGIWPGVATFLILVQAFMQVHGVSIALPDEVIRSTRSPLIRVRYADGFLRVPKLPAAGLYGSQLFHAGRQYNLRALCRLPLLPPLALSALVAYHLTGDDKGIW